MGLIWGLGFKAGHCKPPASEWHGLDTPRKAKGHTRPAAPLRVTSWLGTADSRHPLERGSARDGTDPMNWGRRSALPDQTRIHGGPMLSSGGAKGILGKWQMTPRQLLLLGSYTHTLTHVYTRCRGGCGQWPQTTLPSSSSVVRMPAAPWPPVMTPFFPLS